MSKWTSLETNDEYAMTELQEIKEEQQKEEERMFYIELIQKIKKEVKNDKTN